MNPSRLLDSVKAPVAALVLTGALTGALLVTDDAQAVLEQSPIGTWLANDDTGSITHAGPGGVDATVELDGAVGPLSVVQDGDDVFVVDAEGRMSRIDESALAVGAQVELAGDDIQVVTGGGRLYAVDARAGTVEARDPQTLAPLGDPVDVGGRLGLAVVDADGVLWVPAFDTGEVVSVDGGRRRSTRLVAAPGVAVRVAVVDDEVVAVDPAAATVTTVSGGAAGTSRAVPIERGARIDTPDRVRRAVLPVLDRDRALVVLHDAGGGRARQVDLAVRGHSLGRPQSAAGRTYVPDLTDGALLVIDNATGRRLPSVVLTGRPGALEVVVRGDIVYVNAPDGDDAWVIDAAGRVERVRKYDTGGGDGEDAAPPTTIPPPTPPDTPSPGTPPPPPPPDTPSPGRPPATPPTLPAGAGNLPGRPGATPAPQAPGAGEGAVRGVVAEAGDAEATVSWEPPTGWGPVTAYLVGLEPGGNRRVEADRRSVTVDGLTNGTSYRFVVTALRAAGPGASVASNPVVPGASVPGAVRDLDVVAGDASVDVSWAPATGGSVDGHVVEVVPAAGQPGTTGFTRRVAGDDRGVELGGLVNGATYHVTVTATGPGGSTGPPVASPRFTPVGAPGAPRSVTASPSGDGEVTVTWQLGPDGGRSLTGHVVEAAGVAASTVGGGETRAVVGGLESGRSYTFSVRATNGEGDGPAATAAPVVPQAQVPDPPGALEAVAGDAQVSLSWTEPTGNGTAVTSYTVRNLTDGRTTTTSATSLVVGELTNGVAYSFEVSATGQNGRSGPPGPAASATPAGAPAAPGGVVAVATSATTATVEFGATSPSNGTPVVRLEVRVVGGGTVGAGGSSPVLVGGLTPDTEYSFEVVAHGDNGLASPPSAASAPITTPSEQAAPGAPGNVQAGAVHTDGYAAWDPAPVPTSFPVLRYRVDPGDGTPAFEVTGTNASWATQQSPGTYQFSVVAINEVGESPPSVVEYFVPQREIGECENLPPNTFCP